MEKEREKILEVKDLKKYFKTGKGMLHAVDEINFHVYKGETLGLVGESGCGKSTTGRLILRLLDATSGSVVFEGRDIQGFNRRALKQYRKECQMVFQDPFSSLDPRMSIMDIIGEPLEIHGLVSNRKEKEKKVKELMDYGGVSRNYVNSYPHELDGGRRQRVGIARALAVEPKLMVLDEPVSALDVSMQAQILNLFDDLQKEFDLTYIFIAHDLSVVEYVSDRIAVMYMGKIMELSDYEAIIRRPSHPYTKALVSAIPIPSLEKSEERIILEGDVPSPVEPGRFCRFYGRCRERQEICKDTETHLREVEPNRHVNCLLR